jgi:transposase
VSELLQQSIKKPFHTSVSQADYQVVVEENQKLQNQVRQLYSIINELQRASRPSKTVHPASSQQIHLFPQPEGAIEEATRASEETTITVPSYTRVKRKTSICLDGLPRERVEYPVETQCSGCGGELQEIGEEIKEEIVYIPARVVVREHVQVKQVCPCCADGVRMNDIDASVRVLPRCKAGADLLAKVAVAKFVDGLPLDRLENMFSRDGLIIPKARLSDWVLKIGELLTPVANALRKDIFYDPYIHADETRLLRQHREKAGLHQGYLWGVLGTAGVVFHYADSRKGLVATEILSGYSGYAGYSGYVMTDAYSGYGDTYLPPACIRICCWAHVRRKFADAVTIYTKEQNAVLQVIAALYKDERSWQSLSAEERHAKRLSVSQPRLEKLHGYLLQLKDTVIASDKLSEAIGYALNQWSSLIRFVERGDLPLDNNAIERQMRPIAIGRKNYLFAGSVRGAKAAAVLYSLLSTCKIHDVNPTEYLADVLRRINDTLITQVHTLTPLNWKQSRHAR